MKKLIVFLSLCIIMTSMVSAMEWDNVASYKNDDMTIEITNWLGLGETLGEATLTSHTSVDEVKYVMPGEDRLVMSYEFDFSEGYTNGLGDLVMKNLRNNGGIKRDYYYAIGTVEKYNYTYTDYTNCDENNNNCDEEVITQERERTNWVKMDDSNIPKGKTLIGLFTDVYEGDYIDGIWEIAGRKVSKHAAWTAGYTVGLQAYYNMSSLLDSYSGGYDLVTLGADPNFTTSGCKNNLCAGFSTSTHVNLSANVLPLAQSTGETTWNFWYRGYYNVTNIEIIRMSTAYNQYIEIRTNNELLIDGVASVGDIRVSPVEFNNWYMITLITNATNACGFLNGELQDCEDGVDNYEDRPTFIGDLNYLLDEMAVWNRSLSAAEITTMYDSGTGMFYIPSSSEITLVAPDANYTTNLSSVTFNTSITVVGSTIVNASLWLGGTRNDTVSLTGTTNSTNWTKTIADGDYPWTVEMCRADVTCAFASDNRTIIVDTTAPNTTVAYPNGVISYAAAGVEVTLNFTVVDSHLDTCWFEYNSVNTTVPCTSGTPATQNFTLADKDYLTLYANDTAGNFNSTYANWTASLSVNSLTYNGNTYETATETFAASLTVLDPEVTQARLVYDGINYTITNLTIDGTNLTLSRTIDVPLTNSTYGNQTKEFYFSFSYTGDTPQETASFSQNVSFINLQQCNGTYTTQALNFTFYDEINQTVVPSATSLTTLEAYFPYWIGAGTTYKNYTFQNLSSTTNNYQYCIYPYNASINFKTNSDMEYSAVGYRENQYHLRNATLTNISSDILLHLVHTSDATKFFLTFQQGNEIIPDATVTVQKYFTGLGTYKTVGILLTDNDGEATMWQEVDAKYLYSIVKDGVLLGTAERIAACSVAPCTLTIAIDEAAANLFEPYYNTFSTGVLSNLSYNKTIKMITYNFIDTTGLANYFRLEVNEVRLNSSVNQVCNEQLYSVAGTLTCNLSAYNNAEFLATTYISRSPEVVDLVLGVLINEDFIEDQGLNGVFLILGLIITIVFAGAIVTKGSPSGILWFLAGGILILKIMNFFPFTWIIVVALEVVIFYMITKVKI